MGKRFSINLIFFLYVLIVAVIFAVAEAKVVVGQGNGEVTSVEPVNKLIAVEIDGASYMLVVDSDTVYKGKGVKSLEDIKPEENVFVKYEIDEHGIKTLTLLKKK